MPQFLSQALQDLKERGLYRNLPSYDPLSPTHVLEHGKPYLLLCSNNYLGMTHERRVQEAAADALYCYGTGSGGARLTSGSHPLFAALEQKIADFKHTEAALVFNTGYMANVGVISALMNENDCIFSDALNHASIIDGYRLSKATCHIFPHNDMQVLQNLLEQSPRTGKRLIVVDGVFSMDGDVAPLDRLTALAKAHDALLMVDDAHATGVLGKGRGTAAHFGLEDQVDLQMGTLSKAIGSEGAYVAASREWIEFLANRARSFIYSTALSPATIAASLAAFHIIETDETKICKLLANAAFMRAALLREGIRAGGDVTPILPIVIGDAKKAVAISEKLKQRGILLSAIRPPTVPVGQSRLRLTVCADHSQEDLAMAAKEIAAVISEKHNL